MSAFDPCGYPALSGSAQARCVKPPPVARVLGITIAKNWVFASQAKDLLMRGMLIATAAIAAAMVATPAAAQIYVSIGTSPYGYGYSPYSYAYRPYSYGYSSYGYVYPRYRYSTYRYGKRHRHRTAYSCLRRHHRNGVIWYTRVC